VRRGKAALSSGCNRAVAFAEFSEKIQPFKGATFASGKNLSLDVTFGEAVFV
jgi:hypothetical protein